MAFRRIPYLVVIILMFHSVHGQTVGNIKSLKDKFTSADSIVIISHEITAEYGFAPDLKIEGDSNAVEPGNSTNQKSAYLKFIVNQKVNPEIFKESTRLTDSAINDLSNILLRQVLKKQWVPTKCDQPQHSILIYKSNRQSYIDICFGMSSNTYIERY